MIKPAFTRLYGFDNQLRNFFIFFGISFACHLFIFGLIAFARFTDFPDRTIITPAPITVDLVALNPEIPLPPPRDRQLDRKPSTSTAHPRAKSTKKEISSKPDIVPVKHAYQKKVNPSGFIVKTPRKARVKKSLKKKSLNTAKVLASAVKQIAKQSEIAHPKTIEERIKQLKKEVENPAGPLSKSTVAGPRGVSYPKGFGQIEVYQAEVSVRLKNNWVFSEELAGNTKGLETRLVIKILPDGTITDVWYEKRSGNSYLDDSAYKTVMKSNPLPPLPEGYPYYHLVLGFTPSGLHQ